MVGAAAGDRWCLRLRCRCSTNRSSKGDKGVAKDDVVEQQLASRGDHSRGSGVDLERKSFDGVLALLDRVAGSVDRRLAG
jgi:hypothetical protein